LHEIVGKLVGMRFDELNQFRCEHTHLPGFCCLSEQNLLPATLSPFYCQPFLSRSTVTNRTGLRDCRLVAKINRRKRANDVMHALVILITAEIADASGE